MAHVKIEDVTYADANPTPAKPPSLSPIRLHVATPCYGCQVSNIFLLSVMQLHGFCSERGISCLFDFIGNESLVQRARNVLAARFLKSNCTHLLFIDADIGFRPDTVLRLINADKDIATAVYPKKAYNWDRIDTELRAESKEPIHMMGLDYNINMTGGAQTTNTGFVEVLDSATGFMLIKRGVIEKMAEAYKDTLLCVNDLPGNRQDPNYCTEYVALFDCMIDPDTRRYLSEDYAFVRRAQALGYKTWADITTPLCHVGNTVFEGDLRQRFSMVYSAA